MIVLLAIFEKQVISEQFVTQPLSGRAAIFAKVAPPTETKLDCEIVGVYTDLEAAGIARANYATTHPGRRYLQKVCTLDDAPVPLPPATCLGCGMVLTDGRSFCMPCSDAHNLAARAADPMGGAGDAVPLRPATHGPSMAIRNAG